ncbi:hypothetical protein IMZ48_37930 [Candidatus Bathyarchaeota archaeon]|nr:hypothetical protein [Candidatus Bathyarchaeota archaeon]
MTSLCHTTVIRDEDISPEPQPCRVTPSVDQQSSVSSSLMMETARCTTGSWPAETLVAECGHYLWGDTDDGSGATFGYFIPAAILGSAAGLAIAWMR